MTSSETTLRLAAMGLLSIIDQALGQCADGVHCGMWRCYSLVKSQAPFVFILDLDALEQLVGNVYDCSAP